MRKLDERYQNLVGIYQTYIPVISIKLQYLLQLWSNGGLYPFAMLLLSAMLAILHWPLCKIILLSVAGTKIARSRNSKCLTMATNAITIPAFSMAMYAYQPHLVMLLWIQWNPSKMDAIRITDFFLYSEVSLTQGLVVDYAPPTIVAIHDKARLSKMKKTVLIRDLLILALRQEPGHSYLGNIATAGCQY